MLFVSFKLPYEEPSISSIIFGLQTHNLLLANVEPLFSKLKNIKVEGFVVQTKGSAHLLIAH